MASVSASLSYQYSVLTVCSLILGLLYMSVVYLPELQKYHQLSSAYIITGRSLLVDDYAIAIIVRGKLLLSWGWRLTFNLVMVAFIILMSWGKKGGERLYLSC